MMESGFRAHMTEERSALEAFWQAQAARRPEQVHVLTEINLSTGGSLVATIGHRFLIWEAWGELTEATTLSSMQAIHDAAQSTAAKGTRLAGFFDLTRVEIFEEDANRHLIALRKKLEGRLAFERTAVVFGGAMSRITYNMAALLQPSPWDERVFPSVDEALTWLQDPLNTELLDVDGLSWIV
jgi:hypothetical protein